jgi:MGT family glycosyltransferase
MAEAGRSAAEHWAAEGLAAPDNGGMYDGLYIDIAPPSIQFPEISSVAKHQLLRPDPYLRPQDNMPTWLASTGDAPLVAVTLGTVYGTDIDLLRAVLDGLADEDVTVVVGTGNSEITSALAPYPRNALVYDWVPWTHVLKRAAVAVTHGGAGSTLACLYHGVPIVLVPLGADHFTNCRAIDRSGAAVVLRREEVTAEALRQAVLSARSAHSQAAARRLADEISTMPPAEDVARCVAGLI